MLSGALGRDWGSVRVCSPKCREGLWASWALVVRGSGFRMHFGARNNVDDRSTLNPKPVMYSC